MLSDEGDNVGEERSKISEVPEFFSFRVGVNSNTGLEKDLGGLEEGSG